MSPFSLPPDDMTAAAWTCSECGYASDDPSEEREHNCDDEEVLLATGHMHCAICERWGTVPGSTRCQECTDEEEVLDGACDREPQRVPRFELGRIVATPGAIETMERRSIDAYELLARHVTGDWGDLNEEDKRENELSVTHGFRILSVYGAKDDPDRLWVITDAAADDSGSRSATTILRPEDY